MSQRYLSAVMGDVPARELARRGDRPAFWVRVRELGIDTRVPGRVDLLWSCAVAADRRAELDRRRAG